VVVFAYQHMRQQGRAGHSLSDRPFGRWCLVNRAAAATAIFRAPNAQDAQPRRHEVEHLADGFADRMEWAAATRTEALVKIDRDVLTRQMRRKCALPLLRCCLGGQRWMTGFEPREIDVEVFQSRAS